MPLTPDDRLPKDIGIQEAYAAIRTWCQANVDLYASHPERGGYVAESKAYVESLPPAGRATQADMEDALRRVLSSDLEWAYHEPDGRRFKMAAYAQVGLEAAGRFGGDAASTSAA